ncbi:neuropeptide CCHamide-1 receptor-like [Lingula anatina]|uniref:Neuropeptide CCHamide-1 receptor-like n=1 Tax=Lingula anatina TaxID=7574 RepID=A0A1S3HEE2_LINAN|nr:neuropeptide CCHamide-1 receptor-like [Lingula anatina]|eukprot:XP_013384423.1 neuropeptide CCHamide-1 receptor-like [Lingula anatina]
MEPTMNLLINTTENTTDENNCTLCLRVLELEARILPIIFSLIFLVGLAGNGGLIAVIWKHQKKDVSTLLILNLAVGDFLLILVSVPFTATIFAFPKWPFGDVVCMLNEFLQTLSLGVSVFSLTALSLERRNSAVNMYKPLVVSGSVTLRVKILIVSIWAISAIFGVPHMVGYHVIQVWRADLSFFMNVCWPYPLDWPAWYGRFHVTARLFIYLIFPMVIILWSYVSIAKLLLRQRAGEERNESQPQTSYMRNLRMSRKKMAAIVLFLVVLFGICSIPRHIYLLWYHYHRGTYTPFWHIFKSVGFVLSFMNSCLNPLTLYGLSKPFRRQCNAHFSTCCRTIRKSIQ